MGAPPTVFISYAHEDVVWNDRLLRHLGGSVLQRRLEVSNDQRLRAGDTYRTEVEAAMKRARVAILLVSPDFLASDFIHGFELPALLGRREREGLRIIPVLVCPCVHEQHAWLEATQIRPGNGRAISGGSDHQIDLDFAAVAREVNELLHSAMPSPSPPDAFVIPAERVSISRLPVPSKFLFGRQEQVVRLHECWRDARTHVVSIIAMGGAGKSALVGEWLKEMEKDGYRGATRVLGWSFYSQGTKDAAASGDAFIAFALGWFGDPDPTKGSPWEKGERLARLMKQHNTLLVLDGMEPLQSQHDEGMINDPGVGTLVRELAAGGRGLCVISSRVVVRDLAGREETSAPRIDLEELSDEAGAELLDALGVKGTREDKREAARELAGHALAITLLGTYLVRAWRGDLQKRGELGPLTGTGKQGAHAKRVMEAYAKMLGAVELGILCMLWLFDRPADAKCIDALRAAPAIAGLTDVMVGIDEGMWNLAVSALRSAHLLAEESPGDAGGLDAHPLVREHFGERLREGAPEAWRAGHSVLFEHLQTVPQKELPDTEAEMAPLYAAVVHGCRAGRGQEGLEEVLWKRIRRGIAVFNLKQLGAFGADAAMSAAFFDPPWTRVAAGLAEANHAYVLNAAGFSLRALGRLGEAAGPMRLGMEASTAQGDWKGAAADASNLSELHLARGDVGEAVAVARKAVELADKSGDAFQCVSKRTTLADALHQAGELAEARALLEEAEVMQKAWQPGYPLLYSLRGVRYCDLLLGVGEPESVVERAMQTLEWARRGRLGLLANALDHLSLGRAHLLLTPRGGDHLADAANHLADAVAGLRRAGQQDDLPRGLVARAALHLHTADLPAATGDLTESLSISQRCGLRLHEADTHLERQTG